MLLLLLVILLTMIENIDGVDAKKQIDKVSPSELLARGISPWQLGLTPEAADQYINMADSTFADTFDVTLTHEGRVRLTGVPTHAYDPDALRYGLHHLLHLVIGNEKLNKPSVYGIPYVHYRKEGDNSDDLNVPQQAHDLGIKRLGLLTISESQLTKLKSVLGVT